MGADWPLAYELSKENGMEKQEKIMCLNFRKELDHFIQTVHLLTENGALSYEKSFLLEMADTIDKLYDSSIQVLQCHEEQVQEIGRLVKTIFLQPLTKKKTKPLSMKEAVSSLAEQEAQSSDLSTILVEYATYPESTKHLIVELELLSKDLDAALAAI
jgi:hypothetical protein